MIEKIHLSYIKNWDTSQSLLGYKGYLCSKDYT